MNSIFLLFLLTLVKEGTISESGWKRYQFRSLLEKVPAREYSVFLINFSGFKTNLKIMIKVTKMHKMCNQVISIKEYIS